MAKLEFCTAHPQIDQANAGVHRVSDDMVAIFGADQRDVRNGLTDRMLRLRTKKRRTLTLATLSACGIVVMLTTGVIAGTGIFKAAVPGMPVPATSAQVAKLSNRPRLEYQASPVRIQPASVAYTNVVAEQVDVSKAASKPKGRSSPNVVAVRRGVGEQAAPGDQVFTPALKAVVQTARADYPRAGQALEGAARPGCATADECLQSEARDGDKRVMASYEMASAAGVRPATLRDYRDEWLRARGLVARRPQEALRVYGMIESDLRLLAADPSAE